MILKIVQVGMTGLTASIQHRKPFHTSPCCKPIALVIVYVILSSQLDTFNGRAFWSREGMVSACTYCFVDLFRFLNSILKEATHVNISF